MATYHDPEDKRAYQRAWYHANREKCLASQRKWREGNPEQNRERYKAYRDANADKVREGQARWREDNREANNARRRQRRSEMSEEERAAERAYLDSIRERKNAWQREWQKSSEVREKRTERQRLRDARKLDHWVEDVFPLAVLEMDDGVCGICGGDVDPTDFHIDHVIPVSRGGEHSYANVQVAHPLCNIRKGATVG